MLLEGKKQLGKSENPRIGMTRVVQGPGFTCSAPDSGCAILRRADPTSSRDGGTGRRSGLKIRRPQGHGGSTPPPGTKNINNLKVLKPFLENGCFLLVAVLVAVVVAVSVAVAAIRSITDSSWYGERWAYRADMVIVLCPASS